MALKYPNELPDLGAPLNAEALYVVFPDYPVSTEYGYTDMVGHAGALLIASNGLTKYFEFGRYAPNGNMRNISVSNTVIDANGKSTESSLKTVLSELASRTGKNTRIRAAYFLSVDFEKMKLKVYNLLTV